MNEKDNNQEINVELLRQQLETEKRRVRMLTHERDRMREELEKYHDNLSRELEILCSAAETTGNIWQLGVNMSHGKMFKLLHLINRFRNQCFHAEAEERKAFRRWMTGRVTEQAAQVDRRYHPLFRVLTPLKEEYDFLSSRAAVLRESLATIRSSRTNEMPEYEFLQDTYRRCDVIVFAIIDYDYRYQRPQQIADHFAREGHRVFYINADFQRSGPIQIRLRKDNLWLVTLPNENHSAVYTTDFSEPGDKLIDQLEELMRARGIRDAFMIADHPNWVAGMIWLKRRYGFRLVTDYMDDFTGFDNVQEELVEKACLRLLHESDAVVASSNYLADIASRYNSNVTTIRNGTEYEHFHAACGATENKKPVIGYYGAIAHWFDWQKIVYLSKRFPEADIVLIGLVSANEDKLTGLPNVRLLGEKPYTELPGYLKTFDVCLIPFDASINLIKATNPVKFYEYLSAGKKVVATEIPELEPFRDQYVYLANDDELFGDYVEKCLQGTDRLCDAQAAMAFAAQNDWSVRVSGFSDVVKACFPKISIVILCYNQLEYTKQCVSSILDYTAYPNYELILVDNCSQDGTAQWLEALAATCKNVKIVLNKTNRGFAGGNNDGIRVADGDYITLLNNDTLVTRGWLTGLLKHFTAEPGRRVGIVGPVTNSIGNEAMVKLDYRDIEDMPAAAYQYTADHMEEEYAHDGIMAMFCVMLSRELIDEVGLLDEGYGIGMFEDDDYSTAASKAGFTLVLAEDVFIHHFGSVSFKKLEDETYRKTFLKNQAYFEKKWNVKWKMHHYRPEYMPK